MKNIKIYLLLIVVFIIPILIFSPLLKSKSLKEKIESNKIKLDTNKMDYAIAIHGGAGFFKKGDFPEELEMQYKEKLNEALAIGIKLLKEGRSAEDVVVEVIKCMEDSPLYNAGKGAVFTHHGTNELDASIMRGIDLNAGAVAGVSTIKNPIQAAKEVMINSEHVMLAGKGAEEFAKIQELEIVDPKYFHTDKSWNRLQDALKSEKHGTVGCAVLDKQGNLAAGTSTGGRTNKKYGRIGDSPVIGAGTYANNNTCAISATGHGEFFIRRVACYDISALMEYKELSLQEAADIVVLDKLKNMEGAGGIIGLDKFGNAVFSFNTSGMFRGYANSDNEKEILLYKTETEKK
jgi:L-asparaginase / beta-aspartyl-peptidase